MKKKIEQKRERERDRGYRERKINGENVKEKRER